MAQVQTAQSGAPNGMVPPPNPEKSVVFRVMRLYKPSLFSSHTSPVFAKETYFDKSDLQNRSVSDFVISPYLLLPDSFGDIYIGETFTAYVSVINAIQDSPLYNVTLSLRLQTANATHDLTDIRPVANQLSGSSKSLSPNDGVDIIISHKLTELGTHTLRATVQFLSTKSGEVFTVRKFYRFNVLQPLSIVSTCSEIENRIMVQCQVTNSAKSPLYMEEVDFRSTIAGALVDKVGKIICTRSSVFRKPELPEDISKALGDNAIDHLQLLNPGESYAFAFILSPPKLSDFISIRSVGFLEVKWSSSLGEFGVVRGEDALYSSMNSNTMGPSSLNQSNPTNVSGTVQTQVLSSAPETRNVKITCISSPKSVSLGQQFPVTIRITNGTNQDLNIQLQMKRSNNRQGMTSVSALAVNNASTGSIVNVVTGTAVTGGTSGNGGSGGNGSVATGSSGSAGSAHHDDMAGLTVTGLSTIHLGVLPIGQSVDRQLILYPMIEGLHDLKGITIVDMFTNKEFSSGLLTRVMVHDDQDDEETVGNGDVEDTNTNNSNNNQTFDMTAISDEITEIANV